MIGKTFSCLLKNSIPIVFVKSSSYASNKKMFPKFQIKNQKKKELKTKVDDRDKKNKISFEEKQKKEPKIQSNKQKQERLATNKKQLQKEIKKLVSMSAIPKEKSQIFDKIVFEKATQFKEIISQREFSQTKIGKFVDSVQIILQKNQINIGIEQVAYIVEILKTITMQQIKIVEKIDQVYGQIEKIVEKLKLKQALDKFMGQINDENTIVPMQIMLRFIFMISYMQQQHRQLFFQKLYKLIEFSKSNHILTLLYEKYRYNYEIKYEFVCQIHRNSYFTNIENVHHAYLKMLFVKKFKNQFSGIEESLFVRVINRSFNGFLTRDEFQKLIEIFETQIENVQGQEYRRVLENGLNSLINIAKNQDYNKTKIKVENLIQIFLRFSQVNSAGEILLYEITSISEQRKLVIDDTNIQFYKKFIISVLGNIQKKLKYQKIDYLNKMFTYDTIRFLFHFVPKIANVWPEVILELNHARNELFQKDNNKNILISTFEQIYKNLLTNNALGLNNLNFSLKILRFKMSFRSHGNFEIKTHLLLKFVSQIVQVYSKDSKNFKTEHYELIHLLVALIPIEKESVQLNSLYSDLIEKQIELSFKGESSLINNFDKKIIYLTLSLYKLKKNGIFINYSLIQKFINEKLPSMINSLQYEEVYQVMDFCLSFNRVDSKIYQNLLYNLSTFIIFIGAKDDRKTGTYYLNSYYQKYYSKIVKLVLSNPNVFKNVNNRNCFKILELLFLKDQITYSNRDVLTFLEIVVDSSFLIPSFKEHLEQRIFSGGQLHNFSNTKLLKSFQYYNSSLLDYFQGKYDEIHIKKALKNSNLPKDKINQLFNSNIEIYRTIIMNEDIEVKFKMPQPKTVNPDIKYMYACEKIFRKIRQTHNYHFQKEIQIKKQLNIKEVNLDEEKQYISIQQLVQMEAFNDFRLKKRILPRYIKAQVWKDYSFVDERLKIELKDLQLNEKKIADEIMTKVIKGIFGSMEKIKEVCQQFDEINNLEELLEELNIKYTKKGSIFHMYPLSSSQLTVSENMEDNSPQGEQKDESKNEPKFQLISTNNSNYKILYICAYLMSKMRFGKTKNKVMIIRQSDSHEQLKVFFEQNFEKDKVKIEIEEQGEQSEEQASSMQQKILLKEVVKNLQK